MGFIYRFMSLKDFFVTHISDTFKIILTQIIIFVQTSITTQKLNSIQRREAKEVMKVISDLKKDQEKDEQLRLVLESLEEGILLVQDEEIVFQNDMLVDFFNQVKEHQDIKLDSESLLDL